MITKNLKHLHFYIGGGLCSCGKTREEVLEAELAALTARLEAAERERDELREALRRYVIFEESLDGYLELSREFGACEYPESSVFMTEWLERVLRQPAAAAMKAGQA